MWINGPSLPTGRVAMVLKIRPTTLTIKVLKRAKRGRTTPFRVTLVSIRPGPAATGSMNRHSSVGIKIKRILMPRKVKKTTMRLVPTSSWWYNVLCNFQMLRNPVP